MVCLEGIIVYSNRYTDEEVEVCADHEHLDSIVVENSPRLFHTLLIYFDEKYNDTGKLLIHTGN